MVFSDFWNRILIVPSRYHNLITTMRNLYFIALLGAELLCSAQNGEELCINLLPCFEP